MGITQEPRAYAGGGDFGLRGGRACSNGCPSQCQWKQKPEGGEGVCNGSLAPYVPLNNDALLLWCSRLFLQTFPLVELLTSVPLGCLFTANSCPLPGSTLQTLFSSTQPPSATGDTQLRLGCTRLRYRPVRSSYFVPPSTDCLLCSPFIP